MTTKATHLYTFPPFPTPPDGVEIKPYTEFQESGYQINVLEDGIELDGLGIPTVEIRAKHGTDECKTNARPKKRQPELVNLKNPDGSPREKMWYEQWEDTERLRYVGGYDTRVSRADRIHEATTAFNRRSWPPVNTQVRAQWDQFQLFVGILVNTPIWNLKSGDKEGDEGSDDDDAISDDENSLAQEPKNISVNMTRNEGGSGARGRFKRPRPRPPYANYGKKPTIVHTQEEVQELLAEAAEEKEEHLMNFLNEPAKGVQIFLSSYMRRQGLHYSDRNLDILPRLLNFYIRYLIGNRVLPESERQLQSALDVIDRARQELPLTSKIAKTLPDNFSRACEECFGVKAMDYKLAMAEVDATFVPYKPPSDTVVSSEAANAKGTQDVDEQVENVTSPALQPEITTFEMNDDVAPATEVPDDEIFEESLKAGNIQILNTPSNSESAAPNPESAQAPTSESEFNTEGQPKVQVQVQETSDTWGDAASGSWGSDMPTVGSEQWDTPIIEWAIPEPENLLKFLGPTALPLTHTSGIVEWSVRRIKSITIPPPPAGNAQAQQPKRKTEESAAPVEPDPEAVEEELERGLAQVVLEPWMEWEDPSEEPQACKPRILASSRGKVVVQDGVSFDGDTKAKAMALVGGTVESGSAASGSKGKVFDPLKDEIVLLVEPESAKVLRVGMGLGGSWVQIARIGDLEGGETGASTSVEAREKGKSRSKKGKKSRRFWYMNELMVTLTSYHLVG